MSARFFAYVVVAAACSLPLAGGRLAHADSSGPSDASVKAARAKFAEGVRDYDKGQYEKARAAFLQTYGLHKHPAVLLNLAQSCLKSGHTLEADRYFLQYEREATMSADQKKAAESGLAEARQKLGRIDVRGPAGLSVTVDGTDAGTLPLSAPVDVEPGTHAVHAGTADRSVDAALGQTAVAQFDAAASGAAPVVAAPPPAAKSDAFARPKNMLPVYVAGGVAVAGIATGIVMFVAKHAATNSGEAAAALIQAHGGGMNTCSMTDAATVAKFGDACSALATDNSQISTDATVADIGFIVGGAAIVGGVLYYVLAAKEDGSGGDTGAGAKPGAAATSFLVVPSFGRGGGGLSLSGTF